MSLGNLILAATIFALGCILIATCADPDLAREFGDAVIEGMR